MYGKMQEPRLTFHIHRLSGASIMFLLGAHHREWLRPESCRMEVSFSFLVALEGWNLGWLWHSCLLIWQEILHFSAQFMTSSLSQTETLIFPQFLIFRNDFQLIQSGVSIVCLLSINCIQESESSQKNYDCSLFNHMDKMKGICEEK